MTSRQRFGLGMLILMCSFSIMVVSLPDKPGWLVTVCGGLCGLAFVALMWD